MAYSDDTVKTKLAQLNETQDSIMSTGQYIIFFRRYAKRIAALWSSTLHSLPPPKRLNLIYLVNEVVQKEKSRNKPELPDAFAPLIVDGLTEAYAGAPADLKTKLRRVVAVWRDRNVFDPAIQSAIEQKIADMDKGRGAKGKLGGSLFASGAGADGGVPGALKELVNLQMNVEKAVLVSETQRGEAMGDWNATNAFVETQRPGPPVQAARWNGLLKSLASAQSSLQTTLAAREALIAGLEKLVERNRAAREKEQVEMMEMEEKKGVIEERKTAVEDAIMKTDVYGDAAGLNVDSSGEEVPRPEMEPLTPPPMESLTPPPAPAPEQFTQTAGDGVEDSHTPPGTPPGLPPGTGSSGLNGLAPESLTEPPTAMMPDYLQADIGDFVESMAAGVKRPGDFEEVPPAPVPAAPLAMTAPVNGAGTADPRRKRFESAAKRRKTSEDEIGGSALDGLDEEVIGKLG